MLTHAAVLLHGGARHPEPSPLLLLVMNVTGTPQPSEVGPKNGQLPIPIGNMHASGSVVCGGFDVATAEVATSIGKKPKRLMKLPVNRRLYRHITAFTIVPSSDGSKRLPAPRPSGFEGSQTPRRTSPAGPEAMSAALKVLT